jgi:hypothetical protein
MPDMVIACVNTLGNNQPKQFIFTNQHGRLISDTNNVNIPGVPFDEDDDAEILGVDMVELPGVDVAEQDLEDLAPQIVEIDDLNIRVPDPPPMEMETTVQDDLAAPVEPAPVAQPVEHHGTCRSARVQTQTKEYKPSMQGTRYSYVLTQLESQGVLNPDAHMFVQEDFYQADPNVMAAIMTQLSLKSGLREWGNKAYIAVESEMKQLHFHNTFKPMHWSELSAIQRQTGLLESHMFLKEKRDGKIKGRTMARGNKQQDYISKEDASLLTIATESVLLSCIIDGEEERDIAVINIPNVFVQTRVEDKKDMAIIKLHGILVDIPVDMAPDIYKSYATTDKKGVK